MRTVTRRGFSSGLLALLAAGCGGQAGGDSAPSTQGNDPPPTDPGLPQQPLPAAGPPDPGLVFGVVPQDAPPPVIVWSWTTAAQAAEVRAGGVLFTVDCSPTMGRGYLFDLLTDRANAGDAVAARLVGPELLKGRFGWSNPWATVRGATDGESYGLELLAITMKPDTLYARVRASGGDITFVDGAGNAVATADALAAYDRVGGILFENDVSSNQLCGTAGRLGSDAGGGAMLYREIYLGNESRIASFSHKTQEILDALTSSQDEINALRDYLENAPVSETQLSWQCRASSLWENVPGHSSVDRYLASLAFATSLYVPTASNLISIAAELEMARFAPDPFTITH